MCGIESKAIKNKIYAAVCCFIWLCLLENTYSFYSVYVLCAVVGLASSFYDIQTEQHTLINNETDKEEKSLKSLAVLFSVAVTIANYDIFSEKLDLYGVNHIIKCGVMIFSLFITAYTGYTGVFHPAIFGGYKIFKKHIETEETVPPAANRNPWKASLIVFFAVIVLDSFYLIAIYPGALNFDSARQLESIYYGFKANSNPFWHTLLIEGFYKLGMLLFNDVNAATATYVVSQIVFNALVFAYMIYTLAQAGCSQKTITAVSCILVFLPHYIIYSCLIYKDTTFALFTGLLTVSTYRYLKNIGKNRLNVFMIIISSLGFCLVRHNGLLAFLFVVILTAVSARRERKNRKILNYTKVLSAVLIISYILSGPALKLFGNIREVNWKFDTSYRLPIQQVARVALKEDLNSKDKELIELVANTEEIKEVYDAGNSDDLVNLIGGRDGWEIISNNSGAYIKLWLRLGLEHPLRYLEAWIHQTKGYWNGGYSAGLGVTGVDDNTIGIHRIETPLSFLEVLAHLYMKILSSISIAGLLISNGLYVWILLTLQRYNRLNRRIERLICLPSLTIILTLLLGTPIYNLFRYAYPMYVCLPFAIPALLRKNES